MRYPRALIALLAALSFSALAQDQGKSERGVKDRQIENKASSDHAAAGGSAGAQASTDVKQEEKLGAKKDKKLPAVRPEQSSAERTADPHPLEHDEPTGEVK